MAWFLSFVRYKELRRFTFKGVIRRGRYSTKLDSQNFSNHTQFLPCPRTGKGANTKGLIICLCHNDRALSERCRFSLLFWFSETRENQAQVYNQTGKGFRPPTPFDLKLNNFKTVHDCPRYDRQHSKVDVT